MEVRKVQISRQHMVFHTAVVNNAEEKGGWGWYISVQVIL